MAIKGKIIEERQEMSGVTKAGKPWRKREYVLETEGQYPKKMMFAVMNDNIEKFGIRHGCVYEVELDIDGREYNGRWYHDLMCWMATLQQGQ